MVEPPGSANTDKTSNPITGTVRLGQNQRREVKRTMTDGAVNSRYRPETVPTTPTNPLANAALVCGIVQFGYLFYKPLALAGIAAIILGHIAIRQIRRSGEGGYRQAKAGLILGYVMLALILIGVIVPLAFGSGGPVVQH